MQDPHGQDAVPPWLTTTDASQPTPGPTIGDRPRHAEPDNRPSGWGSLPTPAATRLPASRPRPVEAPEPQSAVAPAPVLPPGVHDNSPTSWGTPTVHTTHTDVPPHTEAPVDLPAEVPAGAPVGAPAGPASLPSSQPLPQWSTGGDIAADLTPPLALDQSHLISPARRRPRRGLRGFIYNSTRGKLNLGESALEQQERELQEKIRTPLHGDYRIAVLSLKGGVGKTTTTVSLGGAFASIRGDRVIAVDANPDFGTLANRVAAPGSQTIRDLLNAQDTSRYADVRSFTTQADSRLEVIGSERDPAVSEAFSEEDYRQAIDILQHHYNIILTDCGTGLMHSAMKGVLDLANTIIIVASAAMDAAQSADATLNWLSIHGYQDLVANAIVVITSPHPGAAVVDQDTLVNHFRSRTRAVQEIPFDRHLSEGGVVDFDLLDKSTNHAYLELAALVAEDFQSWHRHAE